jgi:multicomponent Na+:H+ antiporter subunit E
MRMLGWNFALALAWCALAGRLTLVDLVVGFAIGYGLLGWLVPSDAARRYAQKWPHVLVFLANYAVEVIVSSLRIAWEVITPVPRRRPGIIRVPLEVKTDTEIAVLANLITFTPGTVTLDISEDRTSMYVHDMFIDHPKASRERIKRKYERWVLRLFR